MREGSLKQWNIKSNPDTLAFGTVLAELTFDRRDHKLLDRKTLYIYNAGPGTLLNGLVEVSPDEVSWGTLDGTTFAGLGSAGIAYGQYESTHQYWRFRARSNQAGTIIGGATYAPGTTVDGTIYGGTVNVSTLTGWWTF